LVSIEVAIVAEVAEVPRAAVVAHQQYGVRPVDDPVGQLREVEQVRANERHEAERAWMLRFIQETMGDTDIDELMRPVALAQAYHGIDSPEAEAEYEKVNDAFDRILEERYPWVFENLEMAVPRIE